MADWSHPGLGDAYNDVLVTYLNGKDQDLATMFLNTPTNQPVGTIRYNRSTNVFEEWDGSAWQVKVIGITGFGGGSAALTRTALGLGTMATQDNNAVSITGGSISGVTLDASTITSGILALARGGLGASLAIGANGTFLQSNGSLISFGTNGSSLTGLNASNLASGTVPLARMPSIVNNVRLGTSTSSLVITAVDGYHTIPSFNTIITPGSSANRIRIQLSINVWILWAAAGDFPMLGIKILRNGSAVKTWGNCGLTGITNDVGFQVYLDYIDSPAITNVITYTVQASMNLGGAGSSMNINVTNGGFAGESIITATEISA